jgi:hypothetical protein
MNWLAKYRLNPDWFFPDDESETEKTNREEIFELIRNHDLLVNEKLENRDAKISHLVGEDYLDPLISLNPYIDFLYGKIDLTMNAPNIVTYYVEDDGKIQSKNVTSQTIYFDNIEKMIEWVNETRKENELFVYLIELSVLGTTKFGFRFGTFPKNLPRYKACFKTSRKKKKTYLI